jgi:lysophospholipase L1-like esterase
MADLLVRVYGDSLSLPRAPDGIAYLDTFPELVRTAIESSFPDVRVSLYNRSSGGMTIDALFERYLHDCSYFGAGSGEVLVIQSGIVDCAPRPVPAFVRALIAKLPGPMRVLIAKVLHVARPYLLKAGLSWRLTSQRRFASTVGRWVQQAARGGARVYVVNIAPTVPAIETHSPGLGASIGAYNELIAQAVAAAPGGSVVLVDVHAKIAAGGAMERYVSASDGHHITSEGNRLYAEAIFAAERERLRAING